MRLLKKIASAKIFFYCSIWLIVLLVIGTIVQKDIGLYRSQQIYFSSWFLNYEFFYLPGGRLTMTVMFMNLVSKILLSKLLSSKMLGINVTHIGVLLLLGGGFLTAYYSVEGSMSIPEGGKSNIYKDYHKIQLSLVDESHKDADHVTAFNQHMLQIGKILKDESFKGQLKILDYARNVQAVRRTQKDQNEKLKGMSKNFKFKAAPLSKEDERNQAGLMFELSGVSEEQDGIYTIFQDMSVHQHIQLNGKPWRVELTNKEYFLPFEVELVDFVKEIHPGTSMARSYHSDVIVHDGGAQRKTRIQMNEPLRLYNHTFFQSSFFQDEQSETTVLAVVKNFGRMFPYISSIIICIGLMIHLLIQLPALISRKAK